MNIKLIMKYFNDLKDDESMYVEYGNGERILIDNRDTINVDFDIIEFKSECGTLVTEDKNITAIRILKSSDVVKGSFIEGLIECMGD